MCWALLQTMTKWLVECNDEQPGCGGRPGQRLAFSWESPISQLDHEVSCPSKAEISLPNFDRDMSLVRGQYFVLTTASHALSVSETGAGRRTARLLLYYHKLSSRTRLILFKLCASAVRRRWSGKQALATSFLAQEINLPA